MKRTQKSIVNLVVILAIAFSAFNLAIRQAGAETVKITLFVGKVSAYVNGREVPLDVPVIIDKSCNRTLVPLRFISESFGANVNWNRKERKITITLNNETIELYIGKRTAYINGKPILTDCKPKILFGRTIVPVRFISEVFGAKVLWFPKDKKIEILFEKHPEEEGKNPAKANPNAVTLIKKTVKVRDGEINKITFYIVKIITKDKTVKILPFLSDGGPKTRESYDSFIKRVKPVAAINGGTFDLEANILTGDVVKNGIPQFVRTDGYEYTETMGVDKNGTPFFADGKIDYALNINDSNVPIVSVNGFRIYGHHSGAAIYTNWYKNKITPENGEQIALVKDGTVKKITDSIYPQTLSDNEWALASNNELKEGDKVPLKIMINGNDYSGSSFVRCGPLLIKNGKAYIDYKKYENLNRTMKRGARSLLGIGKDGNFYFIYTPTPVRLNYGTLSLALERCGMFEYVISLDGGGSALLYYKGKYIAKPGRKIIDIVAAVPNGKP